MVLVRFNFKPRDLKFLVRQLGEMVFFSILPGWGDNKGRTSCSRIPFYGSRVLITVYSLQLTHLKNALHFLALSVKFTKDKC